MADESLKIELELMTAKAQKVLSKFTADVSKLEKKTSKAVSGGKGSGGKSAADKKIKDDTKALEKWHSDKQKMEEKSQENTIKSFERTQKQEGVLRKKSIKDSQTAADKRVKITSTEAKARLNVQRSAFQQIDKIDIQQGKFGNEKRMQNRLMLERKIQGLVLNTRGRTSAEIKRLIDLEVLQYRKASEGIVRSAKFKAAQVLAQQGKMSKSSSLLNNNIFQMQQAVEDFSFAGFRGASNNIALLASRIGGSGGLIAMVGLGSIALFGMAKAAIQGANAAEKEANSVDKLIDKLLKLSEIRDTGGRKFRKKISKEDTVEGLRKIRAEAGNNLAAVHAGDTKKASRLKALIKLQDRLRELQVLESGQPLPGETAQSSANKAKELRRKIERETGKSTSELFDGGFANFFGADDGFDTAFLDIKKKIIESQSEVHLERVKAEKEYQEAIKATDALTSNRVKSQKALNGSQKVTTNTQKILTKRVDIENSLHEEHIGQLETKRKENDKLLKTKKEEGRLTNKILKDHKRTAEAIKKEADIENERHASVIRNIEIRKEADKKREKAQKEFISQKKKELKAQEDITKQLDNQITKQKDLIAKSKQAQRSSIQSFQDERFGAQRSRTAEGFSKGAENAKLADRLANPILEFIPMIGEKIRAQRDAMIDRVFAQKAKQFDNRILERRGKNLFGRAQAAAGRGDTDSTLKHLEDLQKEQLAVAKSDPNRQRAKAAMRAAEKTQKLIDDVLKQQQKEAQDIINEAKAKHDTHMNKQDKIIAELQKLTGSKPDAKVKKLAKPKPIPKKLNDPFSDPTKDKNKIGFNKWLKGIHAAADKEERIAKRDKRIAAADKRRKDFEIFGPKLKSGDKKDNFEKNRLTNLQKRKDALERINAAQLKHKEEMRIKAQLETLEIGKLGAQARAVPKVDVINPLDLKEAVAMNGQLGGILQKSIMIKMFGGGGGGGSSPFGGGGGGSGINVPKLASGGRARANKPHIVGEEGPELFVPGQLGTVMSNNSTLELFSRIQGMQQSGNTTNNNTSMSVGTMNISSGNSGGASNTLAQKVLDNTLKNNSKSRGR